MAEITYPCYWLKKDNRGEWRWTYYAKNGEEIAVSSEGYNRYSDCLHGVRLLQNSKDDGVFYTGDRD